MHNLKKFWFPLFLWCLFIFAASTIQVIKAPAIDLRDFIIKKSFHFVEYFILFLFTFRALKNTTHLSIKKIYFYSILFIIIYAATDELHQTLVPTREGKLRDVIIDTFGGSFAALILWKYLPKAPKKLKSWAKKLQVN